MFTETISICNKFVIEYDSNTTANCLLLPLIMIDACCACADIMHSAKNLELIKKHIQFIATGHRRSGINVGKELPLHSVTAKHLPHFPHFDSYNYMQVFGGIFLSSLVRKLCWLVRSLCRLVRSLCWLVTYSFVKE